MALSKVELQQMIAAYIEAEKAVLEGQRVSMNGRTLDMADLDSIRKGRVEYERRLAALSSGRKSYSLANFG